MQTIKNNNTFLRNNLQTLKVLLPNCLHLTSNQYTSFPNLKAFLAKMCPLSGHYDQEKVKYGENHLLHNFGPIVKYPRSSLTARNCHNFALFHQWRGAHTLNRFGTKIEMEITICSTFPPAGLFTLIQPSGNWVRAWMMNQQTFEASHLHFLNCKPLNRNLKYYF